MSKTLSIAIVASACIATQAFATGPTGTPLPKPAPPVFVQGQQQGQVAVGVGQGGNSQSASYSYNFNEPTASVGNVSGGHASATGGNATNSLSLRMEAQLRDPVATATAPALAVSNGTCMGSTSGGVQGVSFGVSVGGTWVDAGCDARYDTILLQTMGLSGVAKQRICQKPEVAKAMRDAGESCAATPSASAAVEQPQYTDPIIRRRLGLAPL